MYINRLRRPVTVILATCMAIMTGCGNRESELSMQPVEGYPWLQDMQEIQELLAARCLDTIEFNRREVIADIGAGNGYLEAMISMFNDSLTFYIQDIDTAVCNQQSVDKVVDFYQGVKGQPFTSRLIAVNGTDTHTNLPDTGCDKILMLWTYQYLTEPRAFISDIRDKLKPDGRFYVINPEQDYEYGLELNAQYGWNGSTVEQQITDIIDCGFKLIRFSRNYNDDQLPYIMVFEKDNSLF